MNAQRLLADVLGMKIESAIRFRNSYSFFTQKKKGGSLRKIYIPHADLMKLQKRLLKGFFYKGVLDIHRYPVIIRFCYVGRSYIENARWHSRKNANFVLRLDLKDAFSSVKTDYLRPILKEKLCQEIRLYQGEIYSMTPLFPTRKVAWFRRMIKNSPSDSVQLNELVDEFVELILSLTTYQGKLPQGAPTSPHLFNLTLFYSGLSDKISQFLNANQIFVSNDEISRPIFSVYTDDFTISSSEPISWDLIKDLIELIEKESCFKVNQRKILYFNKKRIAPLVTGLRLVELIKPSHCLENVLEWANISRLSKEERATMPQVQRILYSRRDLSERETKNILKKALDKDGQWVVYAVRPPKKQIRRVRGLIHRAIFDKTLASKVEGHIASLKAIYGDELPHQIDLPYQKYLIYRSVQEIISTR